jgi:hypothetical protein
MKAKTTPKAAKPPKATPKPPKAKATQTKALPVEPPPEAVPAPDPLAGVTIRAEVLTYAPDYHRPRIHIKTPAGRYYKALQPQTPENLR